MTIPKADSPGESAFMLHCRAEKLEPVREFQFHPKRKWKSDFCFESARLLVEIDGGTWSGGRHSFGSGYERDCEKLAEATVLGWRVLRFTTKQVTTGYAIDTVLKVLKQPPR